MERQDLRIPGRLNLFIALLQIAVLVGLLRLAANATGWSLFLVAVGYGIVMNSAYAMLHEAEHGSLHRNRAVNETAGAVLALFFPAPFHLLRQGHLGHHLRNRSDDEAFDFYFEGENRIWRFLQLYGILTGLFWCVILLTNLAALGCPGLLRQKAPKFDRATVAVASSLNPKFQPLIRIEALGALLVHGVLILCFRIPLWHWFVTLAGFGVMWSALQYVHHFGTERDVANGARNLRTFALIDWIWLNHNWHLNHHQRPTVPWIYLPGLNPEKNARRGSLVAAYVRMWRGPRLTNEHVENRYAGKLIQ